MVQRNRIPHFERMEPMKQTYIVDGVRTPIGKFKGTLAAVRTDDLAAMTIAKLMEKNPDLDAAAIDDVILGCANQAESNGNEVAYIRGYGNVFH